MEALVGAQATEGDNHPDRLVDHGVRDDGLLQLTDFRPQLTDLVQKTFPPRDRVHFGPHRNAIARAVHRDHIPGSGSPAPVTRTGAELRGRQFDFYPRTLPLCILSRGVRLRP
ncbi:hypothetical protein GCM10010280_22480 [Streptomyces pilosus]|uniref:Uncharacterized protein n=1 Tax=Streptomyces pilosus TaxID=28893 RepID=A0A918BKK5_9ACTN|nr:hypothetical protein GCM10010280_22480 [Streptomyces pilosus]